MTALHGEDPLLTRYGVALGTEPDDHALVEQICDRCQKDGLAFLAQWQSAESILTAALAGDITIGTERTAALYHLLGNSAQAVRLTEARLAKLSTQPHASYFTRRLSTLRENIERFRRS